MNKRDRRTLAFTITCALVIAGCGVSAAHVYWALLHSNAIWEAKAFFGFFLVCLETFCACMVWILIGHVVSTVRRAKRV